MATATATIRNVRVSPKKLGLLCGAIKGKKIEDALWIIRNSGKGSREYFVHAITNAESILKSKGESVSILYIKNASVDKGTVMKRFRPGARGYSNTYKHFLSHLHVTVSTKPKKSKKDKTNTSEISDKNKSIDSKKAVNKKVINKKNNVKMPVKKTKKDQNGS